MGIVFMASPPDSYSTGSTESASFGADYYTYQYDATRTVAKNAAVTANNIRELGDALANYAGFLFVAMGGLTTVYYGKKFFVEEAEEPAVIPQEVPVEAAEVQE